MNETIKKFITGVRGLGVRPDDTLLVHSSLKSLGHIDGGAEAAAFALTESVPDGTLLMPALNWRDVTKASPYFSAARTPSNCGAITEAFRNYPGVVRSVNPNHSVTAHGVHAAAMTSRHRLDRTPVGPNSPFRLLAKFGGKIMMLGCGLEPNTFMHGVEESLGLPYVLDAEPTLITIEDTDGRAEITPYYMHDFGGVAQRYERAAELIEIKTGKVLNADAFVMDAAALWDAAVKKLSEDPWFFVDRITK